MNRTKPKPGKQLQGNKSKSKRVEEIEREREREAVIDAEFGASVRIRTDSFIEPPTSKHQLNSFVQLEAITITTTTTATTTNTSSISNNNWQRHLLYVIRNQSISRIRHVCLQNQTLTQLPLPLPVSLICCSAVSFYHLLSAYLIKLM